MMKYRRARDGMLVDGSEALDANGILRSGYGPGCMQPGEHIGFDMALLDAAPGNRIMFRDALLTDAETAFRDSAEGREAIAYAKSCAATRDAMGGTRSWTEADERIAVKNAMMARDAHRRRIADADAARGGLAAAEAAAYGQSVRDLIRANRNQ